MDNPKLSDFKQSDLIAADEMPKLFPGTTSQTWNVLRHKGTGPIYVKCAGKIYYLCKDVEGWIAENRMLRPDTPVPPPQSRNGKIRVRP